MDRIIRRQILQMVKADQKIRKSSQLFLEIDKKNTLALKKIIN